MDRANDAPFNGSFVMETRKKRYTLGTNSIQAALPESQLFGAGGFGERRSYYQLPCTKLSAPKALMMKLPSRQDTLGQSWNAKVQNVAVMPARSIPPRVNCARNIFKRNGRSNTPARSHHQPAAGPQPVKTRATNIPKIVISSDKATFGPDRIGEAVKETNLEEIKTASESGSQELLKSQREFFQEIQNNQREFLQDMQKSQREFIQEIRKNQKEFLDDLQDIILFPLCNKEPLKEQVEPVCQGTSPTDSALKRDTPNKEIICNHESVITFKDLRAGFSYLKTPLSEKRNSALAAAPTPRSHLSCLLKRQLDDLYEYS